MPTPANAKTRPTTDMLAENRALEQRVAQLAGNEILRSASAYFTSEHGLIRR